MLSLLCETLWQGEERAWVSLSHRQAGWSNASSEVDISAKRNPIAVPKDAISKDALWPATTATAAAERRAKCWQLKWQIGQTTMRQCDKNDVNRVKQNRAFSWQFPFPSNFPSRAASEQHCSILMSAASINSCYEVWWLSRISQRHWETQRHRETERERETERLSQRTLQCAQGLAKLRLLSTCSAWSHHGHLWLTERC